ncbi:FG-GAP-like repeat-containing protein [Streptomyces sp. NBC_01264]|uniref:FG-GAP-like repeat-containing protein n=1 Tax=Streptomyces sp. NBC_01264 TaxID=2903804 RepID=UPI00224D8F8E|nr:FG-GAP-like repeat-containing protein [Streptomyces sp. NBC_01264]MCX4781720.1 FG-GAP-like repeat-containing protein [Streptomyces sp. NBC_01264]
MSRKTRSGWTAAALCLLVAGGTSAAVPASATDGSPVHGVVRDRPGSARPADTVTPGSAPPLRFVSYNICGNSCGSASYDNQRRIDTIVAQAAVTTWNADQIFLQEVCRPQYDAVLARLRGLGYRGLFSRTVLGRPGICGNADYGNAVFVKGEVQESLDLDLTVGGEKEPIRVPCLKSTTQYRTNWACSVHLYWDDGTLAVPEADRLAARARSWEDQGIPVVLGGDFNHSPRSSTLTRFYDRAMGDGARGDFAEADQSDADFFDPAACTPGVTPACRSGEATVPGLNKKLDYLFLTAADFKDPAADVRPRDTLVSDHRMLRGAAAWADCGRLDAGRAAFFRRDAAGALFRITGNGAGTFADACKVGTGWQIMRHVVRPPQTDVLLGVDAAGDLWRYPADAAGSYSGSTRTRVGGGWQGYDAVLAPGDITGDGFSDLLGRDAAGALWLHAGRADGTTYAARVRTGTGWQTYSALVAPGDFSGDGLPDLLARDRSGVLWLFRGDGRGGFGPRTRAGSGWNIYNALTAPGDVDGDGRSDLLARDGSGVLWSYRGDGAGSYRPRVRVGAGYPAGELLL